MLILTYFYIFLMEEGVMVVDVISCYFVLFRVVRRWMDREEMKEENNGME